MARHRPRQLDYNVCWIYRTPNQDALGMEPCTGEVDGNLRSLPGDASFACDLEIGALMPEEAWRGEQLIQQVLKQA